MDWHPVQINHDSKQDKAIIKEEEGEGEYGWSILKLFLDHLANFALRILLVKALFHFGIIYRYK